MARPKKHYDEDRAAARRKQVLDAAEVCFFRHGFHGASMAAISREAGMSVGHIYNYFDNKEAIIAAMSEQEMTRILVRCQAMADSRERFVGELKAMLRERIADDAADSNCSVLMRDLMAEVGRNETITRAVRDFDRRIREELRGLCRLHQPQLPEPIVNARIEALLVLLDGYGLRKTLNPDIDAQAYAAEMETLIESMFAA